MPRRSISPQDPVAAVLSLAVAVLGALGLLDRWGLGPDQVAMILGASATVAATVRTIRSAAKAHG